MDLADVPYLAYHISWPLCYYQSSHKAKDFILLNYTEYPSDMNLFTPIVFIYLLIYLLAN